MNNGGPSARDWSDPLLRTISIVAVLLAVGLVALYLFGEPGRPLLAVPGIAQATFFVLAMESFAIAFVAFGRYRALPQPMPFWIGLAFTAYAVGYVFVLLGFSDPAPLGPGVITQLLNTQPWLGYNGAALLAILLLLAPVVPWPRPGTLAERWWVLAVIATVIVVAAIQTLFVVFEQHLPTLVSPAGETPLRDLLYIPVLLIFGIGSLLFARCYRRSGDVLAGYTSLGELLLGAGYLSLQISAFRFDLPFYFFLALAFIALTVLLFGLLADYAHIFRREQTARVREREARAEADQRAAQLAATIASIADAVYVVDAGGRVTLTNDAGQRLLGLEGPSGANISVDELPGRLEMRHLDGTPVTPADMPLSRALAGETIQSEDLVVRSPRTGREVYLRTSSAPIRSDGQLLGAVAVAKDVTEMIQLDRMKDDFVRVAAHELKTPVTIMKGYAQALPKIVQARPEQRDRMLAAINEGANRITELVQDMLDISQLQAGKLQLRRERIDLPRMVREVVGRMAPLAPGHDLRLAKAEPATVRGDRERLEQVVAHLLENGVKFSAEGGPIDLVVEVRGEEAVVSVRDYGAGIPRSKQPHIFQRFYRAHGGTPFDYGGMGVGLYLSREIVRAHGGRVWFESEEGKGSTFYFSLPLEDDGGGG